MHMAPIACPAGTPLARREKSELGGSPLLPPLPGTSGQSLQGRQPTWDAREKSSNRKELRLEPQRERGSLLSLGQGPPLLLCSSACSRVHHSSALPSSILGKRFADLREAVGRVVGPWQPRPEHLQLSPFWAVSGVGWGVAFQRLSQHARSWKEWGTEAGDCRQILCQVGRAI